MKPDSFVLETQAEDDADFQRDIKLLFVRTNRGRYEEIQKALGDGDITQANRLAHGLKSNADHIGKASLQQAAAEVEQALKDGKDNATWEQLKKLETELKAVLEELVPLFEEAEAKAKERQAPALGPEEVRALFEKLEPLLEEGNLKCLDYTDELRGVAGSDSLIQQIEDFAFEQAIAALAELKKTLGMM